MTTFSFLLALAIGWLMVSCFDPLRGLAGGPRWARSLFRISLALVEGFGFTSLSFLLARMAGVSRPLWFITMDIVCASIFVAILAAGRRQQRHPEPPNRTEERAATNWIAIALLAAILIPSCIRVVEMAWANPNGQWDAWAIWNKHAKFLATSDNWRDAASPLLGATHPEYPMLLPSVVARVWLMSGETASVVPIVTGLLFFAALLGLFVSALAMVRGTMILLSLHPLLYWAASQYADVPLACLMTAALALIFVGSRSALVWAGFCAGMAAWTKQEGGPFAGALILAFLAASWRLDRWLRLLAGAAPLLLLTAWFSLWIAPAGIFAPRPWSAELSLLTDPGRFAIIGRAVIDHLKNLGSGPGHPLILVALLAVTLRIESDRPRAVAIWTATAALFLTLTSYLAAYLVTPLDLSWHIDNSMNRLIVQVWPAMLLTLCALLPPDLDRIACGWRSLFALQPLNRRWAWAGAAVLAAGLLLYPLMRRWQAPPIPAGTPEDYLNESLKGFQGGQYAASIASARQALRLRPEYALAWSSIAAFDMALGRFDEAIDAAQHALRINPNFQAAKTNLAWAIPEKNKRK